MREICGKNALVIINKFDGDKVNKGLYEHLRLYSHGDVDNEVRALIFAEVDGEMACCISEHYANYYVKKFSADEGIII